MGNRQSSKRHLQNCKMPKITVSKCYPWKDEKHVEHTKKLRIISDNIIYHKTPSNFYGKLYNSNNLKGNEYSDGSELSCHEVVEVSKWQEEKGLECVQLCSRSKDTEDNPSEEDKMLEVSTSPGKSAESKLSIVVDTMNVFHDADNSDMVTDDVNVSASLQNSSQNEDNRMDVGDAQQMECIESSDWMISVEMHQSGDRKMASKNPYSHLSKKLQWKSEVDVIYYISDKKGGIISSRATEPLREEEEQQFRNQFAKKYGRTIVTMEKYPLTKSWLALHYRK